MPAVGFGRDDLASHNANDATVDIAITPACGPEDTKWVCMRCATRLSLALSGSLDGGLFSRRHIRYATTILLIALLDQDSLVYRGCR